MNPKFRPILILRTLIVALLVFSALMANFLSEVPDIDHDPVWIEVRKTGKVRLHGIGGPSSSMIVRIDMLGVAKNNQYGVVCCDYLAIGGGSVFTMAAGSGFGIYIPPTNR